MNNEQIEKKKIAVNRMLRCINEYFDAFARPIPMRVLSAKFGRTFMVLGGFNELMDELRIHGQVEIVLSEDGAKVVYPEGCCLKVGPKCKLL